MNKIIKYFKAHGIGFGLTAGSVILVSILHLFGIFDFLELKLYDYRFHTVRGPLTGWRASDSTYINLGTDIVLVEVDDEAYRLMPEAWPYPRGTIWAKVVRNLSKAGAKVIAFDIQFDAPETKSDYLHQFADEVKSEKLRELIPRHGDEVFGEAIADAIAHGTKIVMDTKMVTEANRIPPQYIARPVEAIMQANPETGLINDLMDEDGFSRKYALGNYLQQDTLQSKLFLTLALKCVKAFEGLADTVKTRFDKDRLVWYYGDHVIKSNGIGGDFSVNYYGPASGYKFQRGSISLPPWGTFPRFSLAQIIDTEEVILREPGEDIDWMSQFIPGEMPAWIQEIMDPKDKQEMIELMGFGEEFDITTSPFYNKIVIIGVVVEVFQDYKKTPFYNYIGVSQITPGMETHGNAIQTILHENYLKIFGGRITNILSDVEYGYYKGFFQQFLLISLLSAIAFFTLTYVSTVLGGFLLVIEGIIFFAIVCGLFTQDLFWFIKSTLSSILPGSFVKEHFNWFQVSLPGIGESLIVPIVVPLAGMIVTYASNMLYQFINEQKDKRFLKNTFGNYISPDLIDQMYEEKQEPKLGGDLGYHTTWFSDIQSFSAFSEVLEPEKMVSLMNEYLTEMTNVLLDHHGTLDKYIGDSIVAFWGAPVPVENHEYLACMTALEMEIKLGELREKWKSEEGWPEIVHDMQHRVGLSAGELVTGNMGSTMRMNYTMMGDMVNLGSRLESSAKQYGVYIQVEETLYGTVKDQFEWRFLDYVRVKGRNAPVKTYELLAEKDKLDENTKNCINKFHDAQKLYFDQKWDKAINGFKESEKLENMFAGRNTNPSTVYIDRCKALKENPPGKDWDGVWTLTAK